MFSQTTDPPPAVVISQVNPCNILQSFSKCGRLTVFLNTVFNAYDVYTLDKEYFFLFLKQMIAKKKITRSELSFFKHHKDDKEIKKIHETFPQLKRMEVLALIDYVKEDELVYEKFAETIGLEVPKKKKLTKKDKAAIEKRSPTVSKPKSKLKSKPKEKSKPKVVPASFDSWKDGFSKKES